MTKYRIIRASNREPLSNWVDDPTEFLAHLASRPEWASKEIVQSTDDPDYDPDTITSIAELDSTYPDRIATWSAQCGYIGDLDLDIPQSDIDNEERFDEFEKAAEAAARGEELHHCKECGKPTDMAYLEPPNPAVVYVCEECCPGQVTTMTSGELLQRLIDRAEEKENE